MWSPSALLDQGFLIFAGLASFWLAWLVWREAWRSGGWWLVGLFFVVWSIIAYLALPRMHRILSSIYVPNYFIGRTRTADGLLGDPVNLALRGHEAQIHHVMTAAGWTLADEITPRSVWQIIVSTLTRKSYPSAPVSSLFLFGRRQDFAYQQEVDGSPGKRHHVRFWRCPKGWPLPGGHQVDWLAAGTFDRSVGLSLFTLQVTHKIDENIDIERDYIVETVRRNSPKVSVTNLRDFSTGYHSRNGGGDSIQTDGNLPVLELAKIKAEAVDQQRVDLILDATSHRELPDEHDTLLRQLWSRRPPQIAFGVVLTILAAGWSLMELLAELFNLPELRQALIKDLLAGGWIQPNVEAADGLILFMTAIALVWTIFAALLAALVFRGGNRPRVVLMALSSLTAFLLSLGLTVDKITWATVELLALIGANIVVVLLLYSDSARRFTRARSSKADGDY